MNKNEKKNLQGREEELIYFRYSDEVNESKLVTRHRKVKDTTTGEYKFVVQQYERKQKKEIIFSEEDVKSFTLEKFGQALPRVHGQYTAVDNYFLDYWSHILGKDACMVFFHLLRYCFGRDIAFPSLDLIAAKMNCNRKTLNSYLEVLEKYGFIYRFWTKKVNDNNKQGTIVFKVRQTIPFLSEELIKELPRSLHEEHKKDIARLEESYEVELNVKDDYDAIFQEFMKSGEVSAAKEESKITDIEELYKFRINRIKRTEEDIIVWERALNTLEERIEKPSFDYYLRHSVAKINGDYVIVFMRNEFFTVSQEDSYSSLIKNTIEELFGKSYEISFYTVITKNDL